MLRQCRVVVNSALKHSHRVQEMVLYKPLWERQKLHALFIQQQQVRNGVKWQRRPGKRGRWAVMNGASPALRKGIGPPPHTRVLPEMLQPGTNEPLTCPTGQVFAEGARGRQKALGKGAPAVGARQARAARSVEAGDDANPGIGGNSPERSKSQVLKVCPFVSFFFFLFLSLSSSFLLLCLLPFVRIVESSEVAV